MRCRHPLSNTFRAARSYECASYPRRMSGAPLICDCRLSVPVLPLRNRNVHVRDLAAPWCFGSCFYVAEVPSVIAREDPSYLRRAPMLEKRPYDTKRPASGGTPVTLPVRYYFHTLHMLFFRSGSYHTCPNGKLCVDVTDLPQLRSFMMSS